MPSGIPKGTRLQRKILQCFVLKHLVISAVLNTDEASVTREDIINTQNNNAWAQEKQHAT
jgi:hypothetical protein